MNGDDVKRSQETEDKDDAEEKDEKDDEEGEVTVIEDLRLLVAIWAPPFHACEAKTRSTVRAKPRQQRTTLPPPERLSALRTVPLEPANCFNAKNLSSPKNCRRRHWRNRSQLFGELLLLVSLVNGQMLVYGSCPNCLSCIEALIKFGVTPSRIAFIESDLCAPYAIDYFNDPVWADAPRAPPADEPRPGGVPLGETDSSPHDSVPVYGALVAHQRASRYQEPSNRAELHCPVGAIPSEISAINSGPAGRSMGTESRPYLDSNLVYDNGLVIDVDFSTNDPHIFAAGPGTRYKRVYFADLYFHEHYNSSEVGAELNNTEDTFGDLIAMALEFASWKSPPLFK
ncbi:unnamed protein product [Nesidiocoris tenuis]|uniref:Uncharacterized protein n=1 Tax=Nesidiocoris tenuis TaxID=355587 RepID=A0A6H5GHN0_9HEMI|nr:unnamed protein product [Nesidiocoris tenuis]